MKDAYETWLENKIAELKVKQMSATNNPDRLTFLTKWDSLDKALTQYQQFKKENQA